MARRDHEIGVLDLAALHPLDNEIVVVRRVQIVHTHPMRAAVQMGDDGGAEQPLAPRHRGVEAVAVIVIEMNFVVIVLL